MNRGEIGASGQCTLQKMFISSETHRQHYIRRFLPCTDLYNTIHVHIVTAIVLSSLDYCNALLSGTTAHKPHQGVQDWAARMISGVELNAILC